MDTLKIIKNAYNSSALISICRNGRNNNDLQVLSYTNDMVTFLKGSKRIDVPMNEVQINVDYTDKLYRDMYCKETVGMTFDQLAEKLERMHNCDECDVTQIGSKYGLSSAKRLIATVNGLELVAAMTYGTVTGIRFPDGTKVRKIYSNTSTRWEYKIL